MRRLVAVALACLSACTTVEHVGRSPSPDTVARINRAVHDGRNLEIERARVEPLERCAGEDCAFERDGREITLIMRDGVHVPLPLPGVSGITVTGHNRGRGALIGAGIGAAVALTALDLLVLALEHVDLRSDPNPTLVMDQGCDAKCG